MSNKPANQPTKPPRLYVHLALPCRSLHTYCGLTLPLLLLSGVSLGPGGVLDLKSGNGANYLARILGLLHVGMSLLNLLPWQHLVDDDFQSAGFK